MGLDPAERTAEVLQADAIGLEARAELARAAVDRSRSAAESVQRSAAAVGTIYAGLAGLAFAQGERSLTAAAVVPALFLGLAICFSTLYVAFLTSTPSVELDSLSPSPIARQHEGVEHLSRVANASASNRAHLLRRSAVALTVGVMLLPVPFLESGSKGDPAVSGWGAWALVVVGLVATFGVAGFYRPSPDGLGEKIRQRRAGTPPR